MLSVEGKQIEGVYATGWIKRGPIGLIGHTKADAIETISHVIADRAMWWSPTEPDEAAVVATLESKGVDFVGWPQWLKIDAQERALGEAEGRERIKLFERSQMVAISKGE